MLAEKMRQHSVSAWLINTGLSGGTYGVGQRISLKHTRAIIDAIHNGALATMPTVEDPLFGFQVPLQCPNVPSEILLPRKTWADPAAYDETARKLAALFIANFETYAEGCHPDIIEAGPRLEPV